MDAQAGNTRNTDQAPQPGIFLCSLRHRLFQPVVTAARGDFEHATHRLDAVLEPMGLDELLFRPNVSRMWTSVISSDATLMPSGIYQPWILHTTIRDDITLREAPCILTHLQARLEHRGLFSFRRWTVANSRLHLRLEVKHSDAGSRIARA